MDIFPHYFLQKKPPTHFNFSNQQKRIFKPKPQARILLLHVPLSVCVKPKLLLSQFITLFSVFFFCNMNYLFLSLFRVTSFSQVVELFQFVLHPVPLSFSLTFFFFSLCNTPYLSHLVLHPFLSLCNTPYLSHLV